MRFLILNDQEIHRLLPMSDCIEVVAEALTKFAKSQVFQPLRTVIKPPTAAGMMGLMPAYISAEEPAYGLKAICIFPGNVAKGKDAHQGSVMLYSPDSGELMALMNASAITAIRTGAASAVATRALAKEDAHVLAIVGAGVQARSHLSAMICVRPIREVRVASRRLERAQSFVNEMGRAHSVPVRPFATVEEAVRGADLIVTATDAAEPVLKREWIARGAHINAVGACVPTKREVDGATMAAVSLFVDRTESALNEAGDYLLSLREGAIGPNHIRAEIGEVLVGRRPGRTEPNEITMFKSLGLAVEDVAVAAHLYRRATREGIGTWADL